MLIDNKKDLERYYSESEYVILKIRTTKKFQYLLLT